LQILGKNVEFAVDSYFATGLIDMLYFCKRILSLFLSMDITSRNRT